MWSSLPFFACVTLNCALIGYFLAPMLATAAADLARGLRRSRLYLGCRLDERRENALRARCLRLFGQLLRLAAGLVTLLLAYIPSLLFATYRSDPWAALLSSEAIAGMFAGAAVAILLRRRT